MTNEKWKILEDAFAAAAGLGSEEQEEFLARFAVSHPDLVQQLRDLLAADGRDDEFLQGPIAAIAQSLADTAADPWLGKRVGHWTIVERIAGGGMGTVFLGERADSQYSQKVAIKLMAAQLLATGAIGRFRAERQILANLSHANIAKLIDGGSTDEGLPYLVMEYIDGLPIDKYCDTNNLSLNRRLALFRKVCEAVDYAHHQLVVHRDLKPSNILVDNNGEPKLLDFGIAKLLEEGAYEHTVAVTREGVRAMTPEYASPEQVRGEPISVATDVYALGVLLYKLMTGTSPYGVSPTTPREYEEAIVGRDPIKPSTVVTSAGSNTGISESRGVSLDRLRKRLVGDLDNIALKALQKEPERRYATANALAADIHRYLASEPVEARGDAWGYKARKFVVRNARGLGIAAVVTAAIAALTIFYTLQLADERDRANLAAAEANEVSTFMTGLFESASPHKSKGETITAVDLLQQGRERIEELDDQPAVQARLMRIMANSMTMLGELEESIEMLERALQMQQAEDPPDRFAISQTTHNLAEAHRQNGDLERAEHFERQALAIAEQELGATSSDTAHLMARLGVILFDARKAEEALAVERKALEIMIANGDGESPSAIDVRGNMGNALSHLGRYDEAEALLRETLELSVQVDGRLAPNTVIRRSNLGLVLTNLERYDEAAEVHQAAIDDGLKVWLQDYRFIEVMRGSLASALRGAGRLDESLVAYREAAAMAERRNGKNNRTYIRRLRGIAAALRDMARYDEAEALVDEGLARAASSDDMRSQDLALLHLAKGRLNIDQGQFAAAETNLRLVLSSTENLSHASVLDAQLDLAKALSGKGEFDEAGALLQEAIAGAEASYGPDSRNIVSFLGNAAAHYRNAGDLQRSLEYSERLAAIIESDPNPPAWRGAVALAEHGKTLHALGEAQSTQVLGRARSVLANTLGTSDPRVREIDTLLDR